MHTRHISSSIANYTAQWSAVQSVPVSMTPPPPPTHTHTHTHTHTTHKGYKAQKPIKVFFFTFPPMRYMSTEPDTSPVGEKKNNPWRRFCNPSPQFINCAHEFLNCSLGLTNRAHGLINRTTVFGCGRCVLFWSELSSIHFLMKHVTVSEYASMSSSDAARNMSPNARNKEIMFYLFNVTEKKVQ